MGKIKVILLLAAIISQVCDVFAQEDLIWINSVVEYSFSSPTDSIKLKKESNHHLENDTSTHIHISSYWDTEATTWVNDFRSIGIYDQNTKSLEMQHFIWNGIDDWIGSMRYVFWYGNYGDILGYRLDLGDPGSDEDNWVRQDSLSERWEDDSLVHITETFRWLGDGQSWVLDKRNSTAKIKNEEDIITSELKSRWDSDSADWIPVSQALISYDSEGEIINKTIHIWIETGAYWIEYLKHEFYYDEGLEMWMEERFQWDFWKSDWGLSFRGGVSGGDPPALNYIIGIRDEKFYRWEVYEKVESEMDNRQLVIGSTISAKRSDYGEWENKSQTRNFYSEEKLPLIVMRSNWNTGSGLYEVDSKKYFYYPGGVTSKNDEIENTSFTIFPNPTSGRLSIDGPDVFRAAYIFDLQGKMLKSSDQNEIDVSYLPAGMYLIRIQSREGGTTTLRFIKM